MPHVISLRLSDYVTNSDPQSPCVRICKMDAASGWCIGCYRTLEEIAGWSRYSATEKAAVLEKLPPRRQAVTFVVETPTRAARSERPARAKVCAQCGATFTCGPQTPGTDCWCDEVPNVLPLKAPADGCLCPACLDATISNLAPSLPPT